MANEDRTMNLRVRAHISTLACLPLFAMAVGCDNDSSDDSGCGSDLECKGNRICEAGQCVDPGGARPAGGDDGSSGQVGAPEAERALNACDGLCGRASVESACALQLDAQALERGHVCFGSQCDAAPCRFILGNHRNGGEPHDDVLWFDFDRFLAEAKIQLELPTRGDVFASVWGITAEFNLKVSRTRNDADQDELMLGAGCSSTNDASSERVFGLGPLDPAAQIVIGMTVGRDPATAYVSDASSGRRLGQIDINCDDLGYDRFTGMEKLRVVVDLQDRGSRIEKIELNEYGR